MQSIILDSNILVKLVVNEPGSFIVYLTVFGVWMELKNRAYRGTTA